MIERAAGGGGVSKPEAAEKLRRWLRSEKRSWRFIAATWERDSAECGEARCAGDVGTEVAAGYVQGRGWTGRAPGRAQAAAGAAADGMRFSGSGTGSRSGDRDEESGELTGRGILGGRLRVAGMRGQYETQLSAASWVGEHGWRGGWCCRRPGTWS